MKPAVVIPVVTQYQGMLAHNLPCTGVILGRRLVVPVGQHKTIAMAGKRRRWPKLGEWLVVAAATAGVSAKLDSSRVN